MNLVKLEKQIDDVSPSFCGEVRGMTLQQVKDRLASESQHAATVQKSMEEDEELVATKALLKELRGPYSDAKKAINNKIKFLVAMLEEKQED